MFEPYDKNSPLGFFPNILKDDKRIPIWDPAIIRIKKMVLEDEFKRKGPFKFVPIAFDKISVNA